MKNGGATLGKFIQLKISLSVSFMVIVFIFGLLGWVTAIHYYRIATVVPLISNDVLAQQTLAQTTVNAEWQTVTIKHGDSLNRIFKTLGLGNAQLEEVMSVGEPARILTHLKPGQELRLLISSDQQLQQLVYNNAKTTLTIVRSDTGFEIGNGNQASNNTTNITKAVNTAAATTPAATTITPLAKQIETNITTQSNLPNVALNKNMNFGSAVVQKSLYEAGVVAGLSHKQAMQLVTLFSQSANLARGIRRGDKLSVLYQNETNYILLAQLTHRNKTYQIFRYTDPKGNTDYYTQDGLSLRPPIVRAPLNYTRISSGFSDHRWQPVLHFFRPHYGVDYAAPAGTPIKAAGDGHIIFEGVQNGYGKVVKIKHMSPYETVYAHMSHFAANIHDGSFVHQGQVIGYVGDTGMSTGDHLHFEIRVNNIPHNPLTVALPYGTPIDNHYRTKYFAMTKTLLAQLDLHEQQQTAVALK